MSNEHWVEDVEKSIHEYLKKSEILEGAKLRCKWGREKTGEVTLLENLPNHNDCIRKVPDFKKLIRQNK